MLINLGITQDTIKNYVCLVIRDVSLIRDLMRMFRSVYQTTPCKDYQLSALVTEISKFNALRPESIQWVDRFESLKLRFPVKLIGNQCVGIPVFGHPLVVISDKELSQMGTIPHHLEELATSTYIDVRNFTRLNRDETTTVNSPLDYNLSILRGTLSRYTVTESPQDFLGFGTFPLTIYSRWIAEQITRRLALPVETQVIVTILAAYFYLCQFEDGEKFDERTILRMASTIAKAVYTSADRIIQIIEPIGKIHDIKQFIDILIKETNNVRFEKFNVVLLYGILGGSWFGFNNRELCAVALEHPPTFLAMLYMACNERGYKNTVFGKMAKDYSKGDADRNFVRSVNRLISV